MKIGLTATVVMLFVVSSVSGGAMYNGKPVPPEISASCSKEAAEKCEQAKGLRERTQCIEAARLTCIGEKMK